MTGAPLRVWSVDQLHELGLTACRIRGLVSEGRLERFSRGWYGTAETPPDVAMALRTGRRLTCISSLAHTGVWVPRDRHLHVAELRSGRGPRAGGTAARGTLLIPHRFRSSWADPGAAILDVRESLEDALGCLDVEDLAIVLESALDRRLLDRTGLEELTARLPVKKLRALGRVSACAQSGTETRVRRFMVRLGAEVREQVGLLPGEKVDMLVGELLVIECDSRAHHTDALAYASDRRRDRELMRRGYRVVRLTWEDVMLRWPETQGFLRGLVAQGLHRAPRGRGAGGERVRRRPGPGW